MKLRCLVVDDDELFLELMEHYVKEHPDLELAGKCSSIEHASKCLPENEIDLVLLDIEMPGQKGVELVRAPGIIPQVIFVTSYKEYAAEAFEYDVTDYIVKPLSQSRFDKAIARAIAISNYQKVEAEEENLYFKVESELVKVKIDDITLIQSLGDYIQLYENGNKHVILGTLNNMQNTLDDKKFMRVHRKSIVRLASIRKLSGHTLTLDDGNEIQVSRALKSELLSRLNKN